MTSSLNQEDQVLVEEKSFVRIVTLNRPKQLNALSFHMISRLLDSFLAFEKDSGVNLIILKGKGRALCAGGDVAAVVHDVIKGNWKSGANYFSKEFGLNYLMATFSKPQVSILNGIVMGGGGGLSIHGSFRVATENTVFAMPETALGLFPDIGASFFLSRLPRFFGEYVGLTGARLDGPELLACGLATHYVPSAELAFLEADLLKVDSTDQTTISSIIGKYSQLPNVKEHSAFHRLDVIDRCFSQRTVEEILSSLEKETLKKKDDWIVSTIETLKKASPTSLKISLRSMDLNSLVGGLLQERSLVRCGCSVFFVLMVRCGTKDRWLASPLSSSSSLFTVWTLIREGRLQGVGQCLCREYRMVCHVLRGEVSKDFFEGCRAILLDKDKNPKWKPSKLEDISDEMVDWYFSKIEDGCWEDLKLPARSDLPASAISKL